MKANTQRFLKSVQAKAGSKWERLFELKARLAGLPEPIREFKFHPTRRWRFDFCWPNFNRIYNRPAGIGVEIDGGGFIHGRHSRGKGMANDALKLCEAIRLGWVVLRFTPDLIESGYAIELVKELLGS